MLLPFRTLSRALSVPAELSTLQSVMLMSDSGAVVEPAVGEPVVPLLVVLPELL